MKSWIYPRQRQGKPELRALPDAFGLGPDAPAVGLDDLARDGQPEAGPLDVAVRQAGNAEKFVEDPLEVFFGDTYAAVAHTHLEVVADDVCGQADWAAAGRVLARVR